MIEGTLRADATPGDNSVALSVDVDAICGDFSPTPHCAAVSGGVAVTVVGSLAVARVDSWRAGRRVRLPAALHRAARYLDPGVLDAERALARHGTTLVGTTKSGALVELVSRGSWGDEALAATRAFSRRAINESVGRWSSRSAGIVAAIVIGDRGALEPDVQRQLQEAGTYHVIAISGGNIAILAGLIVGAFRLAGLLGRLAMVGSIALLIVYAALVGGGASVDRATLMAIVYFGAARNRSSRQSGERACVRRGTARRVAAALDRRSSISAHVRRHACDSYLRRARPARPHTSAAQRGSRDVPGIARDRGAAVSNRCGDLLARHLCRARAELPRDPADGRGAGRRHDRRPACCALHAGGSGRRFCGAPRGRRPRMVGRTGPFGSVRHIPRCATCVLGLRRVLRRCSGRLDLSAERACDRARCFRGRRGVDSRGAMDGFRCARRWASARDVRRCRPGRFGDRHVSARHDVARGCGRAGAFCHLRYWRSGRRASAARGRHPAARLRRADARRSRSHRRRRRDHFRISAARGMGRNSGAALCAAHRAAPSGGGGRHPLVERADGGPHLARRCAGCGGASGDGRLGAPEGEERRLDRHRAPMARGVGAC